MNNYIIIPQLYEQKEWADLSMLQDEALFYCLWGEYYALSK